MLGLYFCRYPLEPINFTITFFLCIFCHRRFFVARSSLASYPAEAIDAFTFLRSTVAMAVNATIYTAFRVLAACSKVTFIARAFSGLLDAHATVAAVVRAALFPTIRTFPTIVAVALGLQAHSVPGAVVQTVLPGARVAGAARGALAVPVFAASSNSTALKAILSRRARLLAAIGAHEGRVAVAFRVFIAHAVLAAVLWARRFAAVDADKVIGAFAFASLVVARPTPTAVTWAGPAGAVGPVESWFAPADGINARPVLRASAVVHAGLRLAGAAAVVSVARPLGFVQAVEAFPAFLANALQLFLVAVPVLLVEPLAVGAAKVLQLAAFAAERALADALSVQALAATTAVVRAGRLGAVRPRPAARALARPPTVEVVRFAVGDALTMAGALGFLDGTGAAWLAAATAFPADRALARALAGEANLALPVATAPFRAHLVAAIQARKPGVALADTAFALSMVVAVVDAGNLLAVVPRKPNVAEALAFEAVAVVGARLAEALVLPRLGVEAWQVRPVLGQRRARELARVKRGGNVVAFGIVVAAYLVVRTPLLCTRARKRGDRDVHRKGNKKGTTQHVVVVLVFVCFNQTPKDYRWIDISHKQTHTKVSTTNPFPFTSGTFSQFTAS